MKKITRTVSIDLEAVIEAQELRLNLSKACNEGVIRAVEEEKKRRKLEKIKAWEEVENEKGSELEKIKAWEEAKKKRELENEKNGGSQGQTTPVSSQTQLLKEYHKESRNDKL